VASFAETTIYSGVVLAGMGIIGTAMYYVFKESESTDLTNHLYSQCLTDIKSIHAPILSKHLEYPIQGQVEAEWRYRRSQQPIAHELLEPQHHLIQFTIHSADQRKGLVQSELRELSAGHYDICYMIVKILGNACFHY
jgi:hypothetical protein